MPSLYEDTLNSINNEKIVLKPLNSQLIDEKYLSNTNENTNHDEIIENNDNNNNMSTIHFKQFFRTKHLSIEHRFRSSLWLNLIQHDLINKEYKFQQAVERYPEDILNMFGRRNDITVHLPSCIDTNHIPDYYLNQKGQHARTRILTVFTYYHPDITWSPLLAPLTSLFLHYMNEIDAYKCLLIITNHQWKFLSQTEIQFQSFLYSFRTLLRRYYYSTYEILLRSHSYIFDQWIWIIFDYLPFKYLIPIIDCLLIEDVKVLIRFAMSLLYLFVNESTQKCKRVSSSSSQKKRNSASTITKLDIKTFVQQLDIPIDKLFKHAFSIHNLRKKEIFRIIQNEEEKIKTERRQLRPLLRLSDTSTSNPSSTSRSSNPQNCIPMIMIREFATTTASHSDFAYLWSLIPSRLTGLQPERVYSSNIHGHRLRTLYNHCEFYENCFIIIRNELDEIFGAFCSSPLATRSQIRTWFGTGESFLFTLKPQRQVFKWVGYQKFDQSQTKSYEDYFIHANDLCLQFGGSQNGLDIGLDIDHELNEGHTKQCDTFANKSLSSNQTFQIIEIEVFGFTK